MMKTTYCVVRMEAYSASEEETPRVEARFDSRGQAERYIRDVMESEGDTPAYCVMTARQWQRVVR